MKPKSGRFVLRIPPGLHRRLGQLAQAMGCSLNQLTVDLIERGLAQTEQAEELSTLVKEIVRRWRPVAVIQYGSVVRGEARASSDVDIMVVMPEEVEIRRGTYRQWDEFVLSDERWQNYQASFAHGPRFDKDVSNIWLEIALEGQILYCMDKTFLARLNDLKDKIASGQFRRQTHFGQPYWVREIDAK